jgi:hypothetical protein
MAKQNNEKLTMAKINLPTKPRPAVLNTPKRMIIFSKPKVGKTFTVSKLPKCLILDFEDGTLAIDALSVPIKKFSDIKDVCQAIRDKVKENEGKAPYNFIAIDTASALEEMCLGEAERRWSISPDGKKWFMADPDDSTKLHPKSGKAQYGSIMHLPYGKGYQLVAEVFGDVINMVEKVTPKLILLAHSTYASLNKEGVEFTSLDIQMSKKCKFTATFKADAIGYMYREGKQNLINFTASEDVGAGGRHRYLEKEHILISEFIEDDKGEETFATYWDKIFAPKKAK